MTKALIDGDILVYRVGFTTQEEPIGIAEARMNTLIERICEATGDEGEFDLYLTSTDHSNYRFQIYPQYKANRKAPKPKWYEELRAHLMAVWDAKVIFGMEADDALGIAQTADTIICTIDKDLDQIPGMHYDFVKDVVYEVSEENALRFFYYQLLMGDSTDNIPGCKGIGPKKAAAAIEGLATAEQFEKRCLEFYEEAYGDSALEKLILYGQCLKIKRKEGEPLWLPDHLGVLKPEVSVVS